MLDVKMGVGQPRMHHHVIHVTNMEPWIDPFFSTTEVTEPMARQDRSIIIGSSLGQTPHAVTCTAYARFCSALSLLSHSKRF
jgi:hypothetical protein